MSEGLNYSINFTGNATQVLQHVNELLGNTTNAAKNATKSIGDSWKSLLAFNQIVQSLDTVRNSLNDINIPGISLNKNMQELSAITGVTGKGLDAISNAARQSAKAFGTDAAQNVESYKIILSKLSPDIAKSSEAMKAMGDNVNILSKSMGGDTVASAGVLTTAMNQFGISTKDPIEASKKMAEMMNVMAAGAQLGSSELPQVGQALENVGMLAKTAGVSFEETNAAIQVLDKAGSRGAEGGIALRNVLASITAPSSAAKDALDAYGISTKKLADPTISLQEKLKLLKPVMGDVNAISKIFEKANIGSAIALIGNTEALDEMTKGVKGTTSAQDQAKIVMESYEERMKRQKARLDDMKVGFFNATESMQPYIMGTLTAAGEVAKLGAGLNAVSTVFNNDFTKGIYKAIKGLFVKTEATAADTAVTATNAGTMGIATIAGKLYATVMNGVRKSMAGATIATQGLSTAIKNIPIIGWIAAAIGLAVAAFQYLWEHSRKFREVLFGIWEAAKAVFNNIGVVVGRIWNIVKVVFEGMWNIAKTVFNAIWNVIKTVFNAIGDVFKWLYDTAKNIITNIYNTIVSAFNWIYDKVAIVFNAIGGFFSGLWKWFADLFKGFVRLINEWIIDPIKNAFNGLMDFLMGIFNWITDKLKKLIQPLIDMYNYIFGSEGMEKVNVAYEKGAKAGGEDFDKDHPTAAKEAVPVTAFAGATNFKPSSKKDAVLAGGGGGGNAKQPGAKSKGEGNSNGGTKSIGSITINKLVENLIIHTTNLSDTKEKIKQAVTETLLTAANDFNLSKN